MGEKLMGFIPTRKEAVFVKGLLKRGEYTTISDVLHDAMTALREKRERRTFAPRPATVEVSEPCGNHDAKTRERD